MMKISLSQVNENEIKEGDDCKQLKKSVDIRNGEQSLHNENISCNKKRKSKKYLGVTVLNKIRKKNHLIRKQLCNTRRAKMDKRKKEIMEQAYRRTGPRLQNSKKWKTTRRKKRNDEKNADHQRRKKRTGTNIKFGKNRLKPNNKKASSVIIDSSGVQNKSVIVYSKRKTNSLEK